MTTTFETAKTGDRVWSPIFGWGRILDISIADGALSVAPEHSCGSNALYAFTLYGNVRSLSVVADARFQVLFWSERAWADPVPRKPVKRPDIAMDTPVWVRDNGRCWYKRHFAGWGANGHILTWAHGSTSHTYAPDEHGDCGVVCWDDYALADPGQNP